MPDSPGSRQEWEAFVAADPSRARRYAGLERYLERQGVEDVAPAWHLCRQGTDFREAEIAPFAIPPRRAWPGMVATLRLVHDEIVPEVGPVEVVSGFRTRDYNRRAGGARRSRHLHFDALDLVPTRAIGRAPLHRRLGRIYEGPGRARRMGLGLYARTRFHIDTHRHRRW